MLILLNLLCAVSLLVWGTYIVRTGVMRVFGARLRSVLSRSVRRKPLAFLAGIAVTALVQSSNATTLLVTSFVAQDLVAMTPALMIILGADVGTALMARILTFDLSWLSPLLIFIGVFFFLSRKQTRSGQLGRVAIGLGLILLALTLIIQAVHPVTQSSGVKIIFSSLTGGILMDALVGAVFAIISYSSLAAVLLTATFTATHVIAFDVALCLVIGANLGSGILAMINNSTASASARRVVLGSLLFKLIGSALVLPLVPLLAPQLQNLSLAAAEMVIYFHVVYNLIRCLLMIPLVDLMARVCQWLIRDEPRSGNRLQARYLDRSALETPALGLANASRETLRIGDSIEQMLILWHQDINGEPQQRKVLHQLNDEIEQLHTDIKLYLAQMPQEALTDQQAQRWKEIIEMSLNLQQAADIIERMAGAVKKKSWQTRQTFSGEGLKELLSLYEQLCTNLQLSLTVFFSRDVTSARRLRRYKHRFRIMNRRYSYAHVNRLHQQNVQSLETSSLHLNLLEEMKRLNSLFCSVIYNVLGEPDNEDQREENG